ncbi:TPA: hypothetical protein N0F65_005411, partial [Lagenidium giganteum]
AASDLQRRNLRAEPETADRRRLGDGVKKSGSGANEEWGWPEEASGDWGQAIGPFGKCGGTGYTGFTTCVQGWHCVAFGESISQCIPLDSNGAEFDNLPTTPPTQIPIIFAPGVTTPQSPAPAMGSSSKDSAAPTPSPATGSSSKDAPAPTPAPATASSSKDGPAPTPAPATGSSSKDAPAPTPAPATASSSKDDSATPTPDPATGSSSKDNGPAPSAGTGSSSKDTAAPTPTPATATPAPDTVAPTSSPAPAAATDSPAPTPLGTNAPPTRSSASSSSSTSGSAHGETASPTPTPSSATTSSSGSGSAAAPVTYTPTVSPPTNADSTPAPSPSPTVGVTVQYGLISAWEQCGGIWFDYAKHASGDIFPGKTRLVCIPGYQCDVLSEDYFQCVPKHDPNTTSLWSQCGGIGFDGNPNCIEGAICQYYNDWYSQCIPDPHAGSGAARKLSLQDLSKNWHIDLAQELEEYLDELEHLTIAFDPRDDAAATSATFSSGSASQSQSQSGRSVMNFAEAALLIQGSSVIYSRKVEYLYALVFQTLAHLSKQQEDVARTQQKQRRGEDGSDDDSQGDGHGHDDEDGDGDGDGAGLFANPLPIYDQLDEAKNITLKASSSAKDAGAAKAGMIKHKNNLQCVAPFGDTVGASIALMGSLVPDERDHGETFKLMSCHLHPSGVLLLDEASRKYVSNDVDGEDQEIERSRRRSSISMLMTQTSLDFDGTNLNPEEDERADEDITADMTDALANQPDAYEGDFGAGDDDGDDHDDGSVDDDQMDVLEASPLPASPVDVPVVEEKDPWAPLDPYDASSAVARPFRKGRSYPLRLPYKSSLVAKRKKGKAVVEEDDVDGLEDPKFKEKFFFSAERPQWTSWVWTEMNETALETKCKKKFCRAPLLMQQCDELWKVETKWKALMRRLDAKLEQNICRQHIQEFMKGTKTYVRETDLSKQVNDWQTKLAPILKEQDQHPPFDIQHCGRTILKHLEDETALRLEQEDEEAAATDGADVIAFEHIVTGMNQYEVCRMFLASLQLANNGNVQLLHGHTAAEQERVPFQMQLLTTTNVYETLQSHA